MCCYLLANEWNYDLYRQFLFRIVFNLLVEQRQRFRRFFFRQIEIRIGKESIFPDRFGICDELDGAMHVAKRESVERETDVEPHVRDEPTRRTFLFWWSKDTFL